MKPSILSVGMVTAVGLNAPSSCAAIRAGIAGHTETQFLYDGDFIIGCPVSLDDPIRGIERLRSMVQCSILECVKDMPDFEPKKVPLLLCVAEDNRPGRFEGLGTEFLDLLFGDLGWARHADSAIIEQGRIGGIHALDQARTLVTSGRVTHCVVAGVDSMLVAETLDNASTSKSLQTAENSDGFIPGEAAAAVLIGNSDDGSCHLECRGIGFGEERATRGSGEPLRGEGMVTAFRAALRDSAVALTSLDYRIADLSDMQYGFKEAALALDRLLRGRKEEFDLWHPAEFIGEVGAAFVPCALGIALTAAQKGYAPGSGLLCHCSSAGSARAVVVLHQTDRKPR